MRTLSQNESQRKGRSVARGALHELARLLPYQRTQKFAEHFPAENTHQYPAGSPHERCAEWPGEYQQSQADIPHAKQRHHRVGEFGAEPEELEERQPGGRTACANQAVTDKLSGNTKPEHQMQSHIPPHSIACYCAPSARARSSTSRATARPSAKPPSTSVRV